MLKDICNTVMVCSLIVYEILLGFDRNHFSMKCIILYFLVTELFSYNSSHFSLREDLIRKLVNKIFSRMICQ